MSELKSFVSTLSERRRVLGLLAAGAAPWWLNACGGGGDGASSSASTASSSSASSTSSSTGSSSTTATTTCSVIPTETAGPYPADGSSASGQTLNVLTLAGIQRSDIRTSIAPGSGTAAGVPLTVTLKLLSASASCTPLVGYAVYLWHCTRDGVYSMYASALTGENYLRGVQVSNASGEVTFTTIFPACYSGRWPHIHFEIYTSIEAALSASPVSDHVKVSQLALPQAVCAEVYASAAGYTSSVSNLAAISLASDNVFGNDSAALQMATVTGSVSAGYAATLTVAV